VPKGRHRARIVQPRNKPAFIHFYQDAETEAYERVVARYAQLVMAGRGLLLGPLRIVVIAMLPIPASWSQKKRMDALGGNIKPTSRPDADNFLKCCLDAMNDVVYKDDSQFVEMSVTKIYAAVPALEIEIFAV
jgi:Holliday junction resolvase RusA-like endonuclease